MTEYVPRPPTVAAFRYNPLHATDRRRVCEPWPEHSAMNRKTPRNPASGGPSCKASEIMAHMRSNCWQGQPHLPGVIRRDGSQCCARCGAQLEPPSPDRAWGAAFQPLCEEQGLKTGPGQPTADSPTRAEGRSMRKLSPQKGAERKGQ